MKNNLYVLFLVLFILVAACFVYYRIGYDAGYKLGSSTCSVIQHPAIPQSEAK